MKNLLLAALVAILTVVSQPVFAARAVLAGTVEGYGSDSRSEARRTTPKHHGKTSKNPVVGLAFEGRQLAAEPQKPWRVGSCSSFRSL